MYPITIACPVGFTDPFVNPATAPIWLDADGVEYLIASGFPEGDYTATEPILAQPDRINVVLGIEALNALAMMGLWLPEYMEIIGTNDSDALAGGLGNNSIYGQGGDDLVTGSIYRDFLYGDTGNDSISGMLGSDFLGGGDGDDTLDGSAGYDALDGGDGNDRLIGGAGNDTLDGGAGDDIVSLVYPNEIDEGTGIQASLTTGTWVDVFGGIIYTDILINVERLGGSESADFIEGDFNDNWLNGNAGDDTVLGLGGDDYLQGQEGNDILDGGTGNDTILGGDSEDHLLGGDGTDSLTGAAGNDTLDGGLGDDILIGGTGDDVYVLDNTDYVVVSGALIGSMTASLGADTLMIDSIGDVVVEDVGEGTDLVQSSVVYALSANVENLTLTGSAAINGYGNTLSNVLTGNAGDNRLVGGGGNDTLIGAAGNDTLECASGNDSLVGGEGIDTASYANASAAVKVRLALTTGQNTGGAGTDILAAIENLVGSRFHDTLTGDANANTLEGGLGNDVLTGGEGTDTAAYVNSSAAVTVSLALTKPQNTGGAGTDTLTTIENLVGSGYNDVLTGSTVANVIAGGTGNDTITGGAGADTLVGENGADLFVLALAADMVVGEGITGGDGVDELRFTTAAASTLVLSAGVDVERVVIGTGTAATAVATATTAINIDASAAGVGLTLIGNAGINTLTGTAYADSLDGGLGNDRMIGGVGNDTLTGGAGNDKLTGGFGSDVFVFSFSPHARNNKDTITDFTSADDDIWLAKSVLTGLSTTGALSPEAFWSGAGVRTSHDATDRILYNTTTGALYYDADGNGRTAAVQILQLSPQTALSVSDLFVI